MAQKNFKANTRTSLINWTGKKLTGLHRGTIQISSGTIIVESGEILSGNFDIDISSLLVTDIEDPKANAQLAGHLFGDDFPCLSPIISDHEVGDRCHFFCRNKRYRTTASFHAAHRR